MLFASILLGSLAYAFFSTRYANTGLAKRSIAIDSDDAYFPAKSTDYLDHAWRHTQGNNTVDYGYPIIGRQEYANALPYAVYNEFNSKLNETGTGYAIEARDKSTLLEETGKGAIDVPGQINLIEQVFTLEEHPRLDLSRQDVTKGRHRRRQWSFVPAEN